MEISIKTVLMFYLYACAYRHAYRDKTDLVTYSLTAIKHDGCILVPRDNNL